MLLSGLPIFQDGLKHAPHPSQGPLAAWVPGVTPSCLGCFLKSSSGSGHPGVCGLSCSWRPAPGHSFSSGWAPDLQSGGGTGSDWGGERPAGWGLALSRTRAGLRPLVILHSLKHLSLHFLSPTCMMGRKTTGLCRLCHSCHRWLPFNRPMGTAAALHTPQAWHTKRTQQRRPAGPAAGLRVPGQGLRTRRLRA